jgi:hypothetical protein
MALVRDATALRREVDRAHGTAVSLLTLNPKP